MLTCMLVNVLVSDGFMFNLLFFFFFSSRRRHTRLQGDWSSDVCSSDLTPVSPVAVVPFDAYGGAIYVPAVINGDSAWLMLDTGLSRTGLDGDWARTVGIVPGPPPVPAVAAAASTAVVDTIRLGELTLVNHRVALYP